MVDFVAILSSIGAAWLVLTGLYFTIDKFLSRTRFSLAKAGANKASADRAWAVVTGASDGIGKAYAIELAKRGFNLLLLSRTEAKLQAVRDELIAKNGVEVDYLAVDFETIGEPEYQRIEKKLAEYKRIGVLVNNVGTNYEYPKNFGDAPHEEDEKIIKINISVTNRLTKIVLPALVENKAGAVINLSSMTGVLPTPLLAVYSGTKAYLDTFSQCLHSEYEGKGVVSQSVTPGLVVSNMSKVRKANLIACDASVIAKRSIDSLGTKIQISPYWFHTLLIGVQLALPRRVTLSFLRNYNVGIRNRALKKAELRSKGK